VKSEADKFLAELTALINKYSIDSHASTPDSILANHIFFTVIGALAIRNDRTKLWHKEAEVSDKDCCYLVHYEYDGDPLGDTLVAICQTRVEAEEFIKGRPNKWRHLYEIVED